MKECEIVKDLLPNYVEGTLRKETQEFIEEHIKTCAGCRDLLNMLQKENKQEVEKEDFEIDFLKKYNRQVKILKGIAITLTTIIIIVWGCILIKNIGLYQKGKYNKEIIDNVYSVTKDINQRVRESDNVHTKTLYINKGLIQDEQIATHEEYYKDMLGKIDNNAPKDKESGIQYCQYELKLQAGVGEFSVDENNQKLAGASFIKNSSYNRNTFIDEYQIETLTKLEIMNCAKIDIREEKSDNKDYYVIRYSQDEKYTDVYEELWVNKDSMLIEKKYAQNGLEYYSTCYEVEFGNVNDEDVMWSGSEAKDREEYIEKFKTIYLKDIFWFDDNGKLQTEIN